MKNYTITVNGKVYDVTVEEKGSAGAQKAAANHAAANHAAANYTAANHTATETAAASQSLAQQTPQPSGSAGAVKIEAGAAGKVFQIALSVGDSVKKGDTIMQLEIMKMETPVVATEDGTVASIHVSVGDMVEAGTLLATLNR
ncbi:MAG: biotin/lipoyl-containing protein [Roseburia sp.]